MPLTVTQAQIAWASNNVISAAYPSIGSTAYTTLAIPETVVTGAATIQIKADCGAQNPTAVHMIEVKLQYQSFSAGFDTYTTAPLSHVLDIYGEFQAASVTYAQGSFPILYTADNLQIQCRMVEGADPGAAPVTFSATWTYQTLT